MDQKFGLNFILEISFVSRQKKALALLNNDSNEKQKVVSISDDKDSVIIEQTIELPDFVKRFKLS